MDNDTDRKVDQLRREGWCLLERIIPKDKIDGVRAHVEAAHEMAWRDYEAMGGNIGFQTGPDGEPGTCPIAYLSEFAPYLGDERLLAVVQAVFGKHIRIAQTEFKTQAPNRTDVDWRGFHSDWPHDLTDRDLAGRVAQPFPDVTMQLSVLWMLSVFSPESGGDGGELSGLADPVLIVPAKTVARIQEMHITLGQMLCDVLEQTCAR